MAFDSSNLHLLPMANGDLSFKYDAGSDTLATVFADGYFNNTDDNQNFTVDDRIMIDAADGNAWGKVSAISSGAVTLQFAGGDLPVLTFATGTDATLAAAVVCGYMEVGTSVATASRVVLPTPYPGAYFHVQKVGSGTQVFEFHSGGSGATAIVYDSDNNRIINLRAEGEGFRVRGSSTSRWRIEYLNHHASAVSEGASVVLTGT